MKKTLSVRRIVLAAALFAVTIALAGNALARYPALGVEWGEVTYYDGNGNPIGGMRIECDGYVATWGSTDGNRGPMMIYPCH
ncbi:DUF6289 family protein [Marilutibacter maris]|nr:DUF6289 family protein [Lysobacter maris]AWV08211.1 hypothetical protein C9I47_2534 [Lysobacter maris]